MTISIKIEKCACPIVWLDTSIIIKISKLINKLSKFSKLEKDRLLFLYDTITTLVRDKKIICPLSEQDEEVWGERKLWFETANSLSLGVKTLSQKGVVDSQYEKCVEAFCNKFQEISLSYKDIFIKDPIDEVEEVINDGYIVSVDRPVLFGEDYQKKFKKSIYEELEKQRKENVRKKVSVDEQIEQEYIGPLAAMRILFERFLIQEGDNEEDQMNNLFGTFEMFEKIGIVKKIMNTDDILEAIKHFIGFYFSEYNKAMPYNRINAYLSAFMMTDKQPIRSGDVMDIKHISTLLPYSDLFITDKQRSVFLNKHNFDEEYNSLICYIGDIEVIESFVSSLGVQR